MDKLTPGQMKHFAYLFRRYARQGRDPASFLEHEAHCEEAARREGEHVCKFELADNDVLLCKGCGRKLVPKPEREGLGSAAYGDGPYMPQAEIDPDNVPHLDETVIVSGGVVDEPQLVVSPELLLHGIEPKADAEDAYRKGYAAGVEVAKVERDALKARVAELESATTPTVEAHRVWRATAFAEKARVARLEDALRLIAAQDQGCGGNVTLAEAFKAAQKIARAALAGDKPNG